MLSPWSNNICSQITIIIVAMSANEDAGTKCLCLDVGVYNYCYLLEPFIPPEYCKMDDICISEILEEGEHA